MSKIFLQSRFVKLIVKVENPIELIIIFINIDIISGGKSIVYTIHNNL